MAETVVPETAPLPDPQGNSRVQVPDGAGSGVVAGSGGPLADTEGNSRVQLPDGSANGLPEALYGSEGDPAEELHQLRPGDYVSESSEEEAAAQPMTEAEQEIAGLRRDLEHLQTLEFSPARAHVINNIHQRIAELQRAAEPAPPAEE